MKSVLTILILLLPLNLWAAQQTILECLGIEEARIHKDKDYGPIYKLNQTFTNEFAGSSNIIIKDKSLSRICHKGDSAAVMLTLELLVNGDAIFDFEAMNQRSSEYAYQISLIDELMRRVPHIFFSYISELQALTPFAGCLNKAIPELTTLQEKFRYLETELSLENLMAQKNLVTQIFNKLKKYDSIVIACQEELAQKKKKEKEQEEQGTEPQKEKKKRSPKRE